MKRILSLILALSLLLGVFLLTACEEEESSSSYYGGYDDYYGDYDDYYGDYEESKDIPVQKITFSKSTYYLYSIGEQMTLNPVITPSDATDKSVDYEVIGNAVTCSDDGIVTALKAGAAYVKATTSNGKNATLKFVVSIENEEDESIETETEIETEIETETGAETEILPSGISLNMSSASLKIGESINLIATISPSNSANTEITWISSNTSVATVNNGTVVAISSGAVTITAKTENGKEATCAVTVIDPITLDFRFESYGNGYAVVGYTGTSDTVTVPSTYNGKNVIAIGTKGKNDGFYQNSDLKTIVLPNTIKDINENAFSGCIALQNITIPSCTTIGDKVFENCKSLKEITLPSGILLFGDELFTGCTKLESITINGGDVGEKTLLGPTNVKTVVFGKDVTSIAEGALSGYSSLTTLTIPFVGGDDSSQGSDKGVLGYIFGTTNYSGSYRVSALSKSFYIPSLLKDITITGGAIGEKAFYYCTKLTSVTIGNSVTSIGFRAFSDCTSLTSITIPNSVTSIAREAFSYCSSLTSVTIGNSVTSIGDYALYNCTSLTSVTIGEGVTSIGYEAFYYCSSLTSITIPNSVTSIESGAFEKCTSLERVNISDLKSWCNISFGGSYANPLYYAGNLYLNGELVTNLVIPNTVSEIKDDAFAYCTSLISVTIPNSVTSIGSSAFYNAPILVICAQAPSKPSGWADSWYRSGVVIWDCDNNDIASDGYIYTTINGIFYTIKDGEATVKKSVSVKDAIIPSNITYRGNSYPVTSIGNSAFDGCTSLTSVTIPNSIKTIGSNAFRDCTSLTSVVIPNSVKTIGYNPFLGCTSLTIYAQAQSKPSGWDYYWNDSHRPVVWGHTHSYTSGKCVCGKTN